MDRLLGTFTGFARRTHGEASGTQQHSFPFRVLQRATNEFDDQNVIGSGGFGKVYLGVLKDGTEVAVKRKKNDSQQGAEQFQVEMEVLSRLKHPNLVSLIGSCDQNDEMILVYEYMEGGTLKSHLYGSTGKPWLSWKQRLEVCVGAAKGLHYLHTSSRTGTIHRDVKPENILLDGNLCAKIGDFGLSRPGPELNQTHVITRVMGTFGYIDPQYFKTGQLSMKSDVYSFGVVLLEVISGRSVIDYRLSAEKVSLVTWGKKMLEEGEVEEIVDKKILGTIHPHNLAMFGGIVLRCLAEESAERPTMEEVLSNLEWELDCVRAEEEVAAGNSDDDESDHAISSQPILHGGGKALRRSEGKNYDRYSGVSHHAGLSAPSTSLGVGGNPMKGKGAVELESIIEDENSYYI